MNRCLGLKVEELDPSKFNCTTIDPVQICLVAMSIALVCLTLCIVGVLVHKTKKSGPTVRDVNRLLLFYILAATPPRGL